MLDKDADQPHTAHTMNLVPVLMVNAPGWVRGLKDGRLSDVAPTLLKLLNLERPEEMTGRSLIEEEGAETAAAQ
jgi:2,3-bisphosphoglycerate-independent phosphoglycerate mutase